MKTKIILSIIMMAGFLTLAVAGLVGEITEISDISEKFSLDVETITKLDSKNINDALKQDYVKEGEDAFIYLYQENGINDFIKIDNYYMNCTTYQIRQVDNCTQEPYNVTTKVCEEVYSEKENLTEEVCHDEVTIEYNEVCNPYNETTSDCLTYEKVYYTDKQLQDLLNIKVKERLELIASVDRTSLKEVIK